MMAPNPPLAHKGKNINKTRRWLPWVILGVISTAVSVSIGTTFDEAIWIAVGRKALAGQALYTEAIDHKTPFILVLAGTLDLAPGSFAVARGIFVGFTAMTAGVLVKVIADSFGMPTRRARAVGLVVGYAASLQTVFTLTVELLAVTVLIGALAASARGKFRTAGVLGALSAFIDIRISLLGIGLLVFSWERGGRRGFFRSASTAIPIGIAGLAFMIAFADTRFGILEMSFASRENPWQLVSQVAVALRALLFVAVALWLVIRPSRSSLRGLTWKSSVFLLLVPAILLAFLSRLDFDHYWLLTLPAVPVLAARVASEKSDGAAFDRRSKVIAAAVIAVSLLPVLLHTARIIEVYQANDERVTQAAEYLDSSLGENGSFVKFGDRAFLAALLPDQAAAPSPVMHYYVLETSRQDRARRELLDAIDNASVIVEEGELAVEEEQVFPHVRPVHRIFAESLIDFPCIRFRHGYVFHFRSEACPPT